MLLSLCQYINHSEFYDFLSYNSSVLGELSDFNIRCIASGIKAKPKFSRETFLLRHPLYTPAELSKIYDKQLNVAY